MVILWQDCYGKGNLRKSHCSTTGRKFPIGNAQSYTVKKDYSSLCMWMTSNWLERKFNPKWKVLNKEVDLGEPTSCLDHENLGSTQRPCAISKDIVDNNRTMLESRISAGVTEKLPCSENLRVSSWSYDMEGNAKKCVERYCELANKTTQQLYKVSTPVLLVFFVLAQDMAKKNKELRAGARRSLQKLWRVDRTFFFLSLNFEQVPGRAYRNCGESTALFFFFWEV